MKKFFYACILAILCSAVPLYSWADCQSDYTDAMIKISKAKQKAIKGEQLDSNAFMAEFQPSMDRLQSAGCASEILRLLQYVQMEQQVYGNGP